MTAPAFDLERDPPPIGRLVASIVAGQRSDGGWGAEPGRPSNTEASALSVIALVRAASGDEGQAAATRGLRWLVAHQQPAGGWPATEQVADPSWMSSVAVLALALAGDTTGAARRGAEWLVGEAGAGVDWRTRLVLWLQRVRGEEPVVDVDVTLKGWAWARGTFSWVEPTSLAMLALQAMAADAELGTSRERAYRLRQGELLLVDRMVPGGGWNYGNSRVLDENLEPYPDTTAWALLALRGSARRDVIATSLDALTRLVAATPSTLARALAVLALRAHGRDATALSGALAAQCARAPLPASARTQALALLALQPHATPFAPLLRA